MFGSESGFRAVVLLVCSAQFMVVLDVSVVNVALPEIRTDLGFGVVDLQWVVNAYALVFAGFLLLGGRLADLYGRRRVFLFGLSLFTVSSLVGGIAGSSEALILARAFQGLGAAILAPTTLTVLNTSFPEGRSRNRALAVWTAVGLAGGTAGNVIGGALTDFLTWRSTFLVNVPVGLVALALAGRYLTEQTKADEAPRLDLPGAVTATAGIISVVYGITRIRTSGLGDALTIAALLAGAAVLVLFLWIESSRARDPLVPLEIFRVRTISAGNVVMLLAGACLMPMWYFLTLYMQNVLGYGPLRTGIGFLPHTLATIVVGVRLTPALMDRFDGRSLIVAGAVITSFGFFVQGLVTADSGYFYGILLPALVISLGGGLLNAPITAVVTSGVKTSEAGIASGLMNTSKQLGGAIGLAALVAVTVSFTQTPQALASSYGLAFRIIAAILLLAAATALLLPGTDPHKVRTRSLRKTQR